MPYARIGTLDMAYDDDGSSENVLVFVHGHPFDRSMWRGQLEHFSAGGWRVIAPDLRGYGESPVAESKTTLEQFADSLASLLDHLGLNRVVLAGLSMGGQIVMEFCRSYRERARGAVLVATFPQAETEEGRRNRYAVADRIAAAGMHAYAEELLPKMLGPATIAQNAVTSRFVLEMMRRAPAKGAAAALRGRAERIDYAPTLAALDCPALIVIGDQDAFTTQPEAERMRDLIKGSRLVWMEGVGHMPNLEAPVQFNAALSQFLRLVRDETA